MEQLWCIGVDGCSYDEEWQVVSIELDFDFFGVWDDGLYKFLQGYQRGGDFYGWQWL